MYSFTGRVRYSEIDEHERLSVPALINYLQDCSTFHAEAAGAGLAHVRETGHSWLLASWKILIDELPRFNEAIRVSTWATSFSGLLAHRNFTVCAVDDEAGARPLVRADSLWFLYDQERRRPIRLPEDEIRPYRDDLASDPPLDMPPAQRSLHAPEGVEPAAEAPITVTGAHIDTNHHVNNAQYVSIALGALPAGGRCTMRELDVRYSKAARLHDTIYPQIYRNEDSGALVSLNDAQGSPYALVQVRA